MPKRNEKLIEALEEIARLKFELVAVRAEIKAARDKELRRIVNLITMDKEGAE